MTINARDIAKLDQLFAYHSDSVDNMISILRATGRCPADSQAKYELAQTILEAAEHVGRDALLCTLAEIVATALARLALLPTPSDPLESGSVW